MRDVRFLVCDDHLLLARSLAQHLTSQGHAVRTVDHPAAALEAIAAHPVDVCLLDLRFGDDPLAGLCALPALRELAPTAILVLMSAVLTDTVRHAALSAGADLALDKGQSLLSLDRLLTKAVRTNGDRRTTGAPERAVRPLTRREHQVLDLAGAGLLNDQIATELGISPHTVRSHMQSARTKLAARNRLEAVTAGTWSARDGG